MTHTETVKAAPSKAKPGVVFKHGGWVIYDIEDERPYILVTWPNIDVASHELEDLLTFYPIDSPWRKRLTIVKYIGPDAYTNGYGGSSKLLKKSVYSLPNVSVKHAICVL